MSYLNYTSMTKEYFDEFFKERLSKKNYKKILKDNNAVKEIDYIDFEWDNDTEWCKKKKNCAISIKFDDKIIVNVEYNGSSYFALWVCGFMVYDDEEEEEEEEDKEEDEEEDE